HETSEVHLIESERPDEPPRIVAPRKAGIEYDIEHWHDELIIRTNADGAEDYKIVTAPCADPSPKNWRDLVPHRLGCLILGTIVFSNWLVRLERENSLPRIIVRDMTSGDEHAIAFDEEAYSLGFGDMLEFDTDILRFTYSIAHVRGGTGKGYGWCTEGKRDKKANTFRDFVSVARHLIEVRITSAGRIVAQGGSAGGMLMGAVANMAPELFKGIAAEVPF